MIIIEKSYTTKSSITIENKEAIKDVIKKINNAKVAGKWKGMGWGKIQFIYPDTTYTLNTLVKVFCDPDKGEFYYLNKNLLRYFE